MIEFRLKKYKKRPLIIEAIQWDGYANQTQLRALEQWGLIVELGYQYEDGTNRFDIRIPTLEGVMECEPGSYIVKGISGEFYPVAEDIFLKTYDEVEND